MPSNDIIRKDLHNRGKASLMSKEVVCIFLLGLVLLAIGCFAMLLSGLEKVLLFSFVFTKTQYVLMDSILLNIPPYIWGITNATFIFGIVLVVIGVIIMVLAKRVRT
ncbi:hypothetical protein CHH67_01530 [Paenibacillus campinasensis]|uniref:Uncharacterized protein n=1 Tax=Paenibacillus campinasensis TaxID=66347 RepID=A0A268F434_9BACL|nr:hypothetical protein CHH67_01530 [Paenibacillus campinasensis]